MARKTARGFEFIALMALLVSLLALSIDAIMPALQQIGLDLGNPPEEANKNQLLLSMVFAGMAPGLMIYGPLSDAHGRKKILFLGISIFVFGSTLSLFAQSFHVMLVGRFVQGFGAASCRVITTAIIRDRLLGREMAKTMSFITMIFVLVPAIAPSVGQFILLLATWKYIFVFILLVALVGLSWFHLRLPETLAKEKQRPLSVKNLFDALLQTTTNPISLGYTLMAGFIFGGFVGYLSSAQQILQIQYGLGEKFPLAFGALALCIGVSSFLNSQLLKKFGMGQLCFISLLFLFGLSFTFCIYAISFNGNPPLFSLISYLMLLLLNQGILFGNMNALALVPLGHIAGTATSIISSIQVFLSVFIGGSIGAAYNGTVIPLVLGYTVASFASLCITLYLRRKPQLL